MRNRILTLGILFLLVFSTIIPISFGYNVKISDNLEQSSTLGRGKTLYVGGSGPDNYTRIKDAIRDAVDGDTVFVYDDSAPYYETAITISKSINLIGENRETTIIDGKKENWGIDVGADGVTISGFTILKGAGGFNPFNNGGIMITSSDNNIISGNIILDSAYGIVIYGSANYNTISDNIIESNGDWGLYVQKSNNNVISMNTFSDNDCGLALENSKNNEVSDNIFVNEGLWIYNSYQNTVFGNLVNGKPLIYLEDESDIVIDDEDAGQVILVNCDNITVQNNDLSNTTVGLSLDDTHNCLILGNTINSDKWGGIWLKDSSNNNISMNVISDTDINGGILLDNSYDNNIMSNTITFSKRFGIYLVYSEENIISMNTFSDNYCGLDLTGGSNYNNVIDNVFFNDGVLVYGAWKNTFLNNYVNNKPLIFLEDESDIIIDEDAGQVILVNCDNITVQDQEISNTYAGILLVDTQNCLISNNILESNKRYGIYDTHSSNNNISMNLISDAEYGISFDTTQGNILLQNTISSNELHGIWFYCSDDNIISTNTIKNNSYYGILIESSNNNIISTNTIKNNNHYGMRVESSNDNIISNNAIEYNGYQYEHGPGLGFYIRMSSNNEISYNNFIHNAWDAYFCNCYSTKWYKNYWNRPRLFPKLIFGEIELILSFPWVNFDWRPASKPYDITGGNTGASGQDSQSNNQQSNLGGSPQKSTTTNSNDQNSCQTATHTGNIWITVKDSIFKTPIFFEHTWSKQRTYTIKDRAEDTDNLWGLWAEFKVTMPRNKAINTPFLNFLQQHPNLFPILQKLLQRLGLQ